MQILGGQYSLHSNELIGFLELHIMGFDEIWLKRASQSYTPKFVRLLQNRNRFLAVSSLETR